MNIFRIPFTYQESHRGVKRRTVILKTALPVSGDQVAFVVKNLNITDLIIGHYIGFQSLKNGQCLF